MNPRCPKSSKLLLLHKSTPQGYFAVKTRSFNQFARSKSKKDLQCQSFINIITQHQNALWWKIDASSVCWDFKILHLKYFSEKSQNALLTQNNLVSLSYSIFAYQMQPRPLCNLRIRQRQAVGFSPRFAEFSWSF